jgi:short-subunit dehydrogenase
LKKSFKEKYGDWALVAGASEGLGAAFAKGLAARGMNLVLLARRLSLLETISTELETKYNIQTVSFQVDLADLDVLDSTLNRLSQPIGLLVYNAAFSPIGYFKDIEAEQLMQIVDVNAKAPLYLVKKLSEAMITRKQGGIILMSSLAGQQGSPKIATYAATKAFNTIFSEGLWKELEQENIDVIASMAGAIRTPGYAQASESKEAPGTLEAEEVAEKTLQALGRTPVVIPGFFNKFAHYIMSRLLGRRQRVNIMYNNTKDLQ